jgi:hypothetical protein
MTDSVLTREICGPQKPIYAKASSENARMSGRGSRFQMSTQTTHIMYSRMQMY